MVAKVFCHQQWRHRFGILVLSHQTVNAPEYQPKYNNYFSCFLGGKFFWGCQFHYSFVSSSQVQVNCPPSNWSLEHITSSLLRHIYSYETTLRYAHSQQLRDYRHRCHTQHKNCFVLLQTIYPFSIVCLFVELRLFMCLCCHNHHLWCTNFSLLRDCRYNLRT